MRKALICFLLISALSLGLVACAPAATTTAGTTAATTTAGTTVATTTEGTTAATTTEATTTEATTQPVEKKTIAIWRGQGTDGEEALYNAEIEGFNAQSATTEVKYEVFPYSDFGTTVRSALSTNSMPDIVYVDGTEVGNLVFLEALAPIEEFLEADFVSQYVDSAFYKIDGKTYGLAQQDGGLAFWANKAYLEKAQVRIATYESPWTKDEFLDACAKLNALDEVTFALDMKTNWGGGYMIYAWGPWMVSLGADFYDHTTMRATGALNSEAAISALEFMNGLYTSGYADATQASDTFIVGESALELTGHWNYKDYSGKMGDNLILVPLPDLGNGSYTGIGGLPFCATKQAEVNGTVENAVEFMKFALGEQFQKQINDANGSMPVLKSAFETVTALKEGGPLYLYAQQLAGSKYAVRPMSPAFPTYQAEVGTAFMDILAGADIKESLDKAAAAIDKVIDENGY